MTLRYELQPYTKDRVLNKLLQELEGLSLKPIKVDRVLVFNVPDNLTPQQVFAFGKKISRMEVTAFYEIKQEKFHTSLN